MGALVQKLSQDVEKERQAAAAAAAAAEKSKATASELQGQLASCAAQVTARSVVALQLRIHVRALCKTAESRVLSAAGSVAEIDVGRLGACVQLKETASGSATEMKALRDGKAELEAELKDCRKKQADQVAFRSLPSPSDAPALMFIIVYPIHSAFTLCPHTLGVP